jgi:hypothetical protein
MKKANDTIGNRTRDLPACSAVPQPLLQWKRNKYYIFGMFLALSIQHAMRMPHFVMLPNRLYSIFPRYLTNGMIFKRKKN